MKATFICYLKNRKGQGIFCGLCGPSQFIDEKKKILQHEIRLFITLLQKGFKQM